MTNINKTAMSEDKPFHRGKRLTAAQFSEHGFTEAPGINCHVGTQISYRNKVVLGAPIVHFVNKDRGIYHATALKDPLVGQFEIISYRPYNS